MNANRTRLLILIALIFVCLATLRFMQRDSTSLNDGLTLALIAAPFFWLALRLRPDPIIQPLDPAPHNPPRLRRHTAAALLGLVMLFIVAENSGKMFVKLWLHPHLQFALMLFGLGALAWGLSGGFTLRLKIPRILIALTLLAFALRVWDAIPVFVDETNFIQIVMVVERHPIGLFEPINSIAAFPRLYPYLQWWTTEIFGHTLTALRLPSAIFGALTVPALFWLTLQLFDRRAAWMAAAFLTVFPLHLQFSRLGMNNVADPLFGTLTFALLLYGHKHGNRSAFVLAGICLGLTQYFYEGGRFVFPVVTLVWLLFMSHRYRLLFLITAIITALPVYYTLFGMRVPLAARALDVGLGTDYWTNLGGLDGFFSGIQSRFTAFLTRMLVEPERIQYYAISPYLMFLFVPLILLGLFYVVWRWRENRLILLWLIVPTAATVTFLAEVLSARVIVMSPVLMLLAALGLYHSVKRLLPPKWQMPVAAVVALAICSGSLLYYFGYHLPEFVSRDYLYKPWQKLLDDMAGLPPHTDVHLVFDGRINQTDIASMVKFLKDDNGAIVTVYGEMKPDLWQNLRPEAGHVFYVYLPPLAELQEYEVELIGEFGRFQVR